MKLKIYFFSITCLLILPIDGMMRRPSNHKIKIVRPPQRRIAFVVRPASDRLHVVPPTYLQEEVNDKISKMNDGETQKYKALNAVVQENAFCGDNQSSHRLLKSLSGVERSLILDQVDKTRGRSLLIKAANIGYLHLMDFLLHHGANAAISDMQGGTALNINPLRLTPELVDKLINNGASCTHTDGLKRTVLHYLAMRANGIKLYTMTCNRQERIFLYMKR